MANRHSHKKLRAAIRSRMARSGESYQQARQALLAGAPLLPSPPSSASPSCAAAQACSGFDLLEFQYFGQPAILASWRSYGVPVAMLLSEAVRKPLLFPRFVLRSGATLERTR